MKRIVLQVFLIGVSSLLSWWLLLRVPDGPPQPPVPRLPGELTLVLSPMASPPSEEEAAATAERMPPPPPKAVISTPSPAPEDSAPPEPQEPVPPEPQEPVPAAEPVEEEPAAPPPEAGTPDGDPEEASPAPPEPRPEPDPELHEDPSRAATRELRKIESSAELMEQATAEVSGRSRKGFLTTFLCSAGDQLDIARYFGESVVLVPRAGLRPGAEYHHRLVLSGEPGIEEVKSPAPLTQYRQYRDLFAFNYESLPRPLRELRRRVFVRGDVFLFAALLPPREWGLVIVRRDAALEEFNRGHDGPKRTHDDVKSFTMRYVRLPGGAFDIQVARISFDDGTVVDTTNGGVR